MLLDSFGIGLEGERNADKVCLFIVLEVLKKEGRECSRGNWYKSDVLSVFTSLAGSGCSCLLPLYSPDGTNSGLCVILHRTIERS